MNFNPIEYQTALKLVNSTKNEFMNSVKEKIQTAKNFKVSSIFLPRQMEEDEISKFIEYFQITDKQIIDDLKKNKNFGKIAVINFQINGINAHAIFFIGDSYPCSLVGWRYFINLIYVTSHDLEIINEKINQEGYPEIVFNTKGDEFQILEKK